MPARPPRCSRRDGAVIVMVSLVLPVLLLILGYSVDLAFMQLARAELQAATDLAAKAASTELADTGDIAAAVAKGKQVASEQLVAGKPLTLENTDFVFGDSTKSKDGKWQFQPGASPTNSVQVNARRTAASPDGPIDLFFSGLMGGGGFEYATSAVASFTNADVCLVLDRSSSMKLAMGSSATAMGSGNPRFCDVPWPDSRWAALAGAIQVFVDKMGTTDADETVAVVTFSSDFTACSNTTQAATLNQPLTTDLSDVTAAMTALSNTIWNGNTEVSVGMALARNELTNNGRSTTKKVMIVLTDGAYTNGIHPSGEAALAASQGIRVHTITFGNTPQSVINNMIETAEAGGGQHFHAPDPTTLNNVFGELGGSFSILTE